MKPFISYKKNTTTTNQETKIHKSQRQIIKENYLGIMLGEGKSFVGQVNSRIFYCKKPKGQEKEETLQGT